MQYLENTLLLLQYLHKVKEFGTSQCCEPYRYLKPSVKNNIELTK